MTGQLNVAGFIRGRFEMLVKDYEYYLARRDEIETKIAEIVLGNRAMLARMQLPGVFHIAAFATQAVVEDARRLPTASKLAAYGGFAMVGNTSGEEKERVRRKGGTGKPLDGEGRRDLKHCYCAAGHTVLNRCPKTAVGKWGWRLVFRWKHTNKATGTPPLSTRPNGARRTFGRTSERTSFCPIRIQNKVFKSSVHETASMTKLLHES